MKTVLISGVAGGIGSAAAGVFVREGWRVIGVDHIPFEGPNPCTDFFVADLADDSQINQLFAEILELTDGLDALINNAAVQLCKPLVKTTAADWDAVFGVNVRAAFLMMRHAFPLLRNRRGSIVNIGSVHARATSRNISAYAASKGGLEALTRAAALEFAVDGIRVNGVHPGAVETTMLKAGLNRGHLPGEATGDLIERIGHKHALGRVGQPEEIAEAILFLADGRKSSFVTGSFLIADGGALANLSTE
jgi:NAD(P)-dependent dehydrogenase (short-subunit alcohol dehydrogenase family)